MHGYNDEDCHILIFSSHLQPEKPASTFGIRNWRFFITKNAALYGTRRHVVVVAGTHHCSVQAHGNIV